MIVFRLSVIKLFVMKNNIFFSLAILLITASCSKQGALKQQDNLSENLKQSEAGIKWTWVNTVGGIGGVTKQPGSDITLALSDSTYSVSVSDIVKEEGKYKIAVNTEGDAVLVFDKNIDVENLYMQQEEKIIIMNDNDLQLFENTITDGFLHKFKKTVIVD